MFLRRQDVIDIFDSSFQEDDDGKIYFQPPGAEIGLPITPEEYAIVTASFEGAHRTNMVVSWIVMIGALATSFYIAFALNRYLLALLVLPAASIFVAMMCARDHLGVLLPFIRRRDELLKSIDRAEAGG